MTKVGPDGSWSDVSEEGFATALGRMLRRRQTWLRPIETIGVSQQHWLQLSLLPIARDPSGCFPDHWRPQHFEPIGPMFLLPAGVAVHTRSECREQLTIVCAFEQDSTTAWLGEDLVWTAPLLKGSLGLANKGLRSLMLRLDEEVRDPGFASDALVELIAGQLAVELGRHFRTPGPDRATGGLAAWRLRRIDERLRAGGQAPTLTELASLVGLSVRHLARGYRMSRQCSISDDIASNRLRRAKQLLAQRSSIQSVAYELGFHSPSSFSAAFRRETGQTPSTYQQHAAAARSHTG